MIVTEKIEDGLVKTYSDRDVLIRKVGTDEIYDIAIDPEWANRQYEETDEPMMSADMQIYDG